MGPLLKSSSCFRFDAGALSSLPPVILTKDVAMARQLICLFGFLPCHFMFHSIIIATLIFRRELSGHFSLCLYPAAPQRKCCAALSFRASAELHARLICITSRVGEPKTRLAFTICLPSSGRARLMSCQRYSRRGMHDATATRRTSQCTSIKIFKSHEHKIATWG